MLSEFNSRKSDVGETFALKCVQPEDSVSQSSTLLHHRAGRGGVQFPLDQPEARTQLQHVPEGGPEAGAQQEQLPEAGPGAAVLLEHQRQLEGGHHAAVAHDPLQPPAAFVRLQVNVEDAAAQPARLAARQPQHLPGDAPRQRLRHQDRGAVQRGLLGPRQAALQHGGQVLAAPVLGNVGGPLGIRQAVVPEVQF